MSDDILTVNLDHLTVAEIEEIEDRTGASIGSFSDKNAPKGKMLRAVAYVTRRRSDPNFTWEQAGELKVVLSDDAVPPTAAAD